MLPQPHCRLQHWLAMAALQPIQWSGWPGQLRGKQRCVGGMQAPATRATAAEPMNAVSHSQRPPPVKCPGAPASSDDQALLHKHSNMILDSDLGIFIFAWLSDGAFRFQVLHLLHDMTSFKGKAAREVTRSFAKPSRTVKDKRFLDLETTGKLGEPTQLDQTGLLMQL